MAHSDSSSVTILMAEDDDIHAALVTRVLRKAGLDNRILRFHDGQEVMEFLEGIQKSGSLEHGSSFLLLLDIYMPRVDGVEVLRELKTDPMLKNIPVIMLTTSDDPFEIQHCYALGCNLFITKSPDMGQYAETLKTLTMLIRVLSVAPLGAEELTE